MKLLACTVGVLALVALLCIAQDNIDDDPCNDDSAQQSCDACLSASFMCSWCPYLPNTTVASVDARRCRLANTPTPCPGGVTEINPLAETVIIKDENLTTSETQGDGLDAIQVSPQNISLKLRRGQPRSFNMTFRSLRNSPLDLYFLIDFSNSQNLVVSILREDLPTIGEEVMANISTNFQMGFGSFVDKATLPYAFFDYRQNFTTENNTIGVRCRGFSECVPTYSFRNSQPLTPSIEELADTFTMESELSGNIDSPEGSLEALLQVAVCTNETGWRPGALHMVFLITDQGYHLAGDGRLAGILRPNDGLCHQAIGDSGGLEYTYGLLQDYPSLFQVRRSLEENLIVPVFTLRSSRLSERRVRESLLPAYMRLADDLSRTRAQAIVFDQSSVTEIIRVIQESYETTVQSISVNQPSVPGYTVTIDPIEGCNMTIPGGSCNLQFDQEVTFRVTVTLDSCSAARRPNDRVQLLGPPFSFTTIDLEPLCDCQCTDEPEDPSELCSSRGQLVCGKCFCDPNNFGDECECEEEITECPEARVAQPDGSFQFMTCSGEERGECTSCGTCRCFDGFLGDACQCTQDSCMGSCSGRGECSCGAPGSIPTCVCDIAEQSGFSFFNPTVGTPGDCACNPDNCYNPQFPNELCHFTASNTDGRSNCFCEGCQCPSGFVDRGDNTCSPEESCTPMIRTCFRCRIGDIASNSPECTNCQNITFLGNNVEPANFSRDCDYNFGNCDYTVFISFEGTMQVLTFTQLDCTNQALPWIITGSLVGAIIVIGLLFLIILKLLLLAYDRHEYKKFTQELKDADFAPVDNPLYLTPQQDYQNPIRRPSRRGTAQQQQQQ